VTVERPIDVVTVLSCPFDAAVAAFAERRGSLLGLVTGEDDDHERVLVTLTVGPSAVDEDVVCIVSDVRTGEAGASMRVQWRPLRLERWLPSFDGVLVVVRTRGETRLSLTGHYTVPLGPVGAFGDGIVGRRVAKLTLTSLVAAIAATIDDRVDHSRAVAVDDTSRLD
jgi:hypothetical protein